MVKRLVISLLLIQALWTVRAQHYTSGIKMLDSTVIADVDMSRLIDKYRKSLDAHMSDVIGVTNDNMIHRRPESPLSRLLADIAFIMGKQWAKKNGAPIPQMALINNGGIRAHLHKGNITRRDIYEISPFENSLTILTLDGRTIKKMFDHASSRGGECLSNATLTICNNKTQSIKIDGEPLDTTKNYTIVTLDYIANGGDNYKMLRGTTQINTGKIFRDAIMEYMLIRRKARKKIKAPTNQRIIIVNNNDDR